MSGGPKNYAYKIVGGKTVCKVRGITLNYTASQLYEFEDLRGTNMDGQFYDEELTPVLITKGRSSGRAV